MQYLTVENNIIPGGMAIILNRTNHEFHIKGETTIYEFNGVRKNEMHTNDADRTIQIVSSDRF